MKPVNSNTSYSTHENIHKSCELFFKGGKYEDKGASVFPGGQYVRTYVSAYFPGLKKKLLNYMKQRGSGKYDKKIFTF